MSILLTHIDDDGKCSAAIAYREMFTIDERPMEITYYNYQDSPILPDYEFHEGEKVIITDLSINDHIMNFVKRAVEAGCRVSHIDHHTTTITKRDTFSDEERAIYDKVYTFFSVKFSATMLMWIWACANKEEREHIESIWDKIDFTENYSHLGFYPEKPNERIYKIPDVIRYVDDYDIWRHDLKDTIAFHYGFDSEMDKQPDSKLWDELLYNEYASVIVAKRYNEPGFAVWKAIQSDNTKLRKSGFETKIPGYDYRCFAVNGRGNSFVFEGILEEYDVCIIFYYDGTTKSWKYSAYSSNINGPDVSVISKSFGGGGHVHAAGFRTKDLIFDI